MDTSDDDHNNSETDGLSSDISGFLSSACMETDIKDEPGDPFSSDNALNFPGDSSRFDSDCILSSSLAENVSTQQTTTCDSTASSYISADGETLASSSVLGGESLLLYDVASTSSHKLSNPVTTFTPPNYMVVSGAESKGSMTTSDQKLEFLTPFQLLTPVSQSHPIVIGNSSAASFVKNVLQIQDTTAHPSSSLASDMFVSDKEPVSLPPGFVLLNPTILHQLSLVQPVSGISSAPLIVQLPQSGVSNSEQPSALDLDILSSRTTNNVEPNGADDNAHSYVPPVLPNDCSSLLTPVSTPFVSLVSLSTPVSTFSSTPSSVHGPSSASGSMGVGGIDLNSAIPNNGAIAPTFSACIPSSSQSQCNQKVSDQPMVISSTHPSSDGNKGLQQILEHFFLQQNKKLVEKPGEGMALNESKSKDEKEQDCTPVVESDTSFIPSRPNCAGVNIKPQSTRGKDLKAIGEVSTFTVPALGGKSGSIVLVVRRNATPTGVQTESSFSSASSSNRSSNGTDIISLQPHFTTANSCGGLQTALASTTTLAETFLHNGEGLEMAIENPDGEEDDEVDGSSASASHVALPNYRAAPLLVPSTNERSVIVAPPVSTNHLETISIDEIGKQSIGEYNPQNTGITDSSGQSGIQWTQIQLQDNSATGFCKETAKENEDIQKLIPLTVSEKLASDAGHPIIICIIQEDGVKRQVNINPVETAFARGGEESQQQIAFHDSSNGAPAENKSESTLKEDVKNGTNLMTELHSEHHPAASLSSSEQSDTSPQAGGDRSVQVMETIGPGSRKQIHCDLCTAVFTRFGNYTRHRKIHTVNLKEDKHFKCPYCSRPFLQRCDMKRHMAIHTNDHPFHCQTCGKGYIRKSDLVVHERFHSKDKAFKCDLCKSCFYQSGDLRRHKRLVHSEQSSLLWSCAHCSRKYAREVTLIRHMTTKHNDILLKSVSTNKKPDTDHDGASSSKR